MYSIDDHIAAARKKEEFWCVINLEMVKSEVEESAPFKNNMQTLSHLARMSYMQRLVRDSLDKDSVAFGAEWSKLIIIENVEQMVQKTIRETGGEENVHRVSRPFLSTLLSRSGRGAFSCLNLPGSSRIIPSDREKTTKAVNAVRSLLCWGYPAIPAP